MCIYYPLISIIVPIYNCEQYLEQCIQSIIRQSYTNLEIILINDGSTDKSVDICNDYAKRDKRISVYNIKNHGVGHARNFGLNKANGYYVVFIDSDDYVELTYIEKLYLSIKDDNTDLGVCSYNDLFNDGRQFPEIINTDKISLLSDNIFNDYGILGYRLSVPWGKIYKLSIIKDNNIIFPEDMVTAEDQIFNDRYFRYVGKYRYIDECLYNYRIGNSNSLSNIRNLQSFYSEKKNLKYKRMFFDDCSVKYKEHILFRCLAFIAEEYNKIDDECYEWAIYNEYEGYTLYERLQILMLKHKIVFPFVYRVKYRMMKNYIKRFYYKL